MTAVHDREFGIDRPSTSRSKSGDRQDAGLPIVQRDARGERRTGGDMAADGRGVACGDVGVGERIWTAGQDSVVRIMT